MDELWLTSVPEHWDSRKIKYAFFERIEKGYPDEPLLVASQNMGVVPKGVYGNRTVEATKDLHNLKLVRVGDFVISLRSFQGGLEYAYYQGIISPAYTVMIPNDHITGGYFRYLAKSRLFIELLQMCVTGIREGQNIDYGKLKNHHIPLPPRDEQDQIVRYLDWKASQINKLINAKRRQIGLLQEQKRAVVNEVYINLTPLRKLSSLAKIGDGLHGTPVFNDKGRVFFVNGNNLGNEQIEFYSNTKTVSQSEYDKYKVDLSERTIMISLNGTIGNTSFYNGERIVLGKSAGYITRISETINLRFLNYYLKSPSVKELFDLSLLGTTIGNLSLQTLRSLSVPVIDTNKQSAIVAHLDEQCGNIEKIITKLNNEIALFAEYRIRLISDVVTGKLDVRGVVVPEYETVEDVAGDGDAEDEAMEGAE
jgi:type I restriction enzyme S subunit